MLKKLFLSICLFLVFSAPVRAFTPTTFVTLVNPVRGGEGWQGGLQNPLDLPKFQYQESTHSAFPVTWALRYDALSDATISAFFRDLTEKDRRQTLAAFLEITPSLTNETNIIYPAGNSAFNANRVFLSGYSQTDRLKLIDAYMDRFFRTFGSYPQSVVAWHLDSYSLQYLQSKYSVLAAMNCDDQYSTDQYRLWGGYLGSPYFPDKHNSLVPASRLADRVNLAMVRWAQRDLFNFYGYRSESSYSVQVNDYLAMGQNTQYFEKLLASYEQKNFNEFTYLNIGLENDYSLKDYRQEIKNVYRTLAKNQGKYNLRFISLGDFGDWFKARYPESSPAYFYQTNDPKNSSPGHVYWYQTPFYRLGLKSENGITKIIDLRVYNRNIYEDYYSVPNTSLSLYHEVPAVIDSVKIPDSAITVNFDIEQATYTRSKQWDYWSFSYDLGRSRLIFEPDKIIFSGITPPVIQSKDIKVSQSDNSTTWAMSPHTPFETSRYTWILLLVVILAGLLLIKGKRSNDRQQNPLPLIVGFVAATFAGLTLFRNGLNYHFGLGFWGPNGHDAIFHLSIIEKFVKQPFDLLHPQISGAQIANYHFLFDYLSALSVKFLNVSSLDFYFRFFPVIAILVLIPLLSRLLTTWGFSSIEKIFAFILVFLSGSLGFLPRLIAGQDIFSGESAFWANQSVSIFLNPPYTLSVIILLLFLTKLPQTKISLWQFILLSLLGGLLAQTKIYAFILLCLGLLFSKQYRLLIGVTLVGLILSFPFVSLGGQAPFVFSPLWFPKSLFASFDRFYWPRFVSAWQVYEASGNLPKLLAVNLFALAAFLLGNLGLRVLGFFDILKTDTKHPSEQIVRLVIIIGLAIPLLFVQNVNPWNTIQFMYYSLFFLSLYTGRFLAKIPVYLSIPLLVVAIATSVGTLKDYIGNFSAARVSYTEELALEKLHSSPDGVVLSPVFDSLLSRNVPTPKPLYSYVSTAYISALSGQPEFLSDTINLDITGFDYRQRLRDIQRFYNTEDKSWGISFLSQNKIRYVVETPLKRLTLSPSDLKLTRIFDSGEINIYKFNGYEQD